MRKATLFHFGVRVELVVLPEPTAESGIPPETELARVFAVREELQLLRELPTNIRAPRG